MDSHIQAFLSQGLDDSVVAKQWFGSIAFEDQTARATVQLSREQQVDHRRLHMLLLILICVKWILQFVRDAVWGGKGRDKIRSNIKSSQVKMIEIKRRGLTLFPLLVLQGFLDPVECQQHRN